MKIGALAEATGTPVETIRFYEREGLLPPPARADNNYRVYLPAHAERLAFKTPNFYECAWIKIDRGFSDAFGKDPWVASTQRHVLARLEDKWGIHAEISAHIGIFVE